MTSAEPLTPRKRVVVAMSGGVDSSLAAALAAEEGFEVIGVTMHLSGSTSRCCSLDDVEDARQVAKKLGVRFFVANYADEFQKEVIEVFADSYAAGRTPIPCVACNKRFKFDHLLARANVFGASRVATGHYARIDRHPDTGALRLWRARDLQKDQTYFLFQLDQEQLAQAWFPLGELTKAEVRERARELGLATADKPESQEICFVPDGDYAAVVERIRPELVDRCGDIVDRAGKVLGRHGGIHRFTVGQRKGLGLSSSEPLYVLALDAVRRRVVVGGVEELGASGALIQDVSWVSGIAPDQELRARVQVRHRHAGTEATLHVRPGQDVEVHFDDPVRAVTPGQAAVFYAGEEVLGGGWIGGPLE
jgi:tRNA-specific 2-thiouridylase